MSLAERVSGSFDNPEAFNEWLDQSGYFLKKPNPVLKLRPPMPETYRGFQTKYPYVIQAPEKNPNYVWVGNRDDFTGNWHPVGEKITPEKVGHTTYHRIGQDQVFGPQHHNINLPGESSLSQEQLQEKLRGLNLPSEGDRTSLFKRIINAQESPDLMKKLYEGGSPTELELGDIVNRHEPINLEQANRLRELRRGGENLPEQPQANNWWQQSNLNPSNWRSSGNPVYRTDGTQLSNAEANNLRAWGEQNLANRAQNLQGVSRLGTGSNPMTVNNMGRQMASSAGAMETGSMGAGTFASRAMPMISLALLANSFLQNSQARKEQNWEEQTQRRMMT